MTGVQKVREHLDPAVIVFDVASWAFQAGRALRHTLQQNAARNPGPLGPGS